MLLLITETFYKAIKKKGGSVNLKKEGKFIDEVLNISGSSFNPLSTFSPGLTKKRKIKIIA